MSKEEQTTLFFALLDDSRTKEGIIEFLRDQLAEAKRENFNLRLKLAGRHQEAAVA